MTEHEALAIVVMLAAAWPWANWPDSTVELWTDELRTITDPHTARQVTRQLIRTHPRPPVIATWLDAYTAALRSQGPTQPALPPSREFISLTEYERRLAERADPEALHDLAVIGRFRETLNPATGRRRSTRRAW